MTTATAGDITIGVVEDTQPESFKLYGLSLGDQIDRLRSNYESQLARDIKRYTNHYAVCEKLRAAGLKIGDATYGSIYLDLDPKEIPAYVKVLGPMAHHGKDTVYGSDDEITVTLVPKAHDHIYICYRRKLKPTDKCQIEVTERTETSRRVVCRI